MGNPPVIDRNESTDKPDPLLCPLCGQTNRCVNLAEIDVAKSCWCNDPTIRFPQELLAQIPADKRRQACVCRACVLAYHKANPAN
ncbi:cysteine-rich CWC family protein [Motilimonas sp. KMU-193]|uniref:cysteine-rich CWC family protein n=1 Tax=Motilimonas sp. KMU-193 TaxID=3388668 RepID=UPI00396B1E2B